MMATLSGDGMRLYPCPRSQPHRRRVGTALLNAVLLATPMTMAPVLAPPAQAFFGGGLSRIVYDPTNHAENLLTAARSLEQINNQIASLANEAQMLANEARNLASLPLSLAAGIEDNFAAMQTLVAEADRLAYEVGSIEAEFAAAYRDFAGSLSDAELVESARQRWRDSVSAYGHALKAGAVATGNIEAARRQTGTLVEASQSATGILQATQAGNQLLAVQTRQISDLTALLAAQGRAEALEQSRRAAAEEQAREQFSRFMSGTAYAPFPVTMFGE